MKTRDLAAREDVMGQHDSWRRNVWLPHALAGDHEPTREGSGGTTWTPGNMG
jgi:hypothetical protein